VSFFVVVDFEKKRLS